MRKLFLSLICFGLILSNLFADDNSINGKFSIGIGSGLSGVHEQYAFDLYGIVPGGNSHVKNTTSTNLFTSPVFINVGYRVYIFDRLAIEPKANISYSSGKFSTNYRYYNENYSNNRDQIFLAKNVNAKYSQTNIGFDLSAQYDLYKGSYTTFGLELSLGYDYSLLNVKYDDNFYDFYKVKNAGSFTYGYGAYLNFNQIHKFNLNIINSSYKENKTRISPKIKFRDSDYFEYSIRPINIIMRLSYSYLF